MNNYIGVYGLGVMGQSLAINIARHNFSLSVYNYEQDITKKFYENRAKDLKIDPCYSLQDFVNSLEKPRKILLMVTAGKVVDIVLEGLVPYLEPGDIVIDAGNSYFKDTIQRNKNLLEKGIHFFGVGVSGGEKGALEGPSIMPSGDKESYKYLEPIFNAIAAHTKNGEVCCNYIGPDGSGHFVKMVHNGIEYGDIQIICEAYQLMKTILHLSNEEMAEVFEKWNNGRLHSYLIEITSKILKRKDPETGKEIVDIILDTAGQKGTGKWTSMEGLDKGVPIPTIIESVSARCLSAKKEERVNASKEFECKANYPIDKETFIDRLEKAVYASKICSYAQGFSLLKEASEEYNWNLNYGEIALLWREGCIIRADFLGDIKAAYLEDENLVNLLLYSKFKKEIVEAETAWRQVVIEGIGNGIYIPCITNSLLYFDGYRTERMPANLLQAQRDWFGAHRYQRIDKSSDLTFHTEWEEVK